MSYLDSDKEFRVGFPVFTKLNVYTFQGILVIRHSIISAKIKMPPETFGLWSTTKIMGQLRRVYFSECVKTVP